MPLCWMKLICRSKMDGRVAVKADDEAGADLHPVVLDLLHGGNHVAVDVVELVALLEALLAGGLDADEDVVESGMLHQHQQGRVVRQVDGGLGDEGEGVFVPFHPIDHCRQDFFFQGILVADEVVVHHEDRAPPAGVVDGVELPDELGGVFQARLAPVEGGDVAEFAVVGAAPGELDAHTGVVLDVDQVPGGHRGAVHGRPLAGAVDMPGCAL